MGMVRDENYNLTEEAKEAYDIINSIIDGSCLIENLHIKGFTFEEISYLIHSEVDMLILRLLLDKKMESNT